MNMNTELERYMSTHTPVGVTYETAVEAAKHQKALHTRRNTEKNHAMRLLKNFFRTYQTVISWDEFFSVYTEA